MGNMRTGIVAVVCTAFGMGTSAMAGVIASDDFESPSYTAGALVPQNGGTGWTGAWSSNVGQTGVTATNVRLAAPGGGYTDGNVATVPTTSANGGYAYRRLTTTLADTPGATYYVSMDAQNLSNNLRFFGLALYNTAGTELTLLGQATGSATWTINKIATVDVVPSAVATTELSSLLLKIEFGGAGVAEQLSFWVNPDYSQLEGSATNTALLVGGTSHTTATDWGTVDRLRIGGGNTTTSAPIVTFAPHIIDNLVFSDSSPFFVPEPASAGLIGLGLAAIALRRRA